MDDTFKPPEGFETLTEVKKRRAHYVRAQVRNFFTTDLVSTSNVRPSRADIYIYTDAYIRARLVRSTTATNRTPNLAPGTHT